MKLYICLLALSSEFVCLHAADPESCEELLKVAIAEVGGEAPAWASCWEFSRAVNGYAGEGYYHRLGDPGMDGGAEWTLIPDETGVVTVAARWTADANRTTCALYTIDGINGDPVEISVDQTQNGGVWVPLANVQVESGKPLQITLAGRETGRRVVANAVALLKPPAGFEEPGRIYGTRSFDNPFLRVMNIAPWSRVSASSWLENMTPDMLVDGNTRFVYRRSGWSSGTRFAARAGRWREEPLVFDFGRTEPELIEGVEVFSREPVAFAVDVDDGSGWRKVADNEVDGQLPQYISFPRILAYSVRVRLLRNTEDVEHYLLGEIRIYGRLRGQGLVAESCEPVLKQVGDWAVDLGTPLRGLLERVQGEQKPLVVDATLMRPFTSDAIAKLEGVAVEAGAVLDFGILPAGAYRVVLTLRSADSGAVVERRIVNAGVRNPAWKRGEIEAFVGGEEAFSADKPGSEEFFLAADINGLDSYHELTDIDYYVQQVAEAGAVAEFHINWRSLEPLPGVYDFGYADRLFGAAVAQGVPVKFLLNPPLTGYVPDFLKDHRMEAQYRDGHREVVDMVSLASPLVQEHARRLFSLLFKRYGQHPASRMWVLNVNGEYLWRIQNPKYEDASEWALCAYRCFLGKRYGTISALNQHWNTSLDSFAQVSRPSFGANAMWADFCDFMMALTADFYRPIIKDARSSTHDGTILLFTAGHQAAEPIISLARDCDIWQSNHGQENPHFIGWAEIWRSFGISRFGEPGFVNIEPLDVTRAFFINAVSGARMYTYRQYNWPNEAAWDSFSRQQKIGDMLVDAEPMRVPVTLVSTYESGLVGASNSFSVGGTWEPTGAFYDALLKRGAIAAYYNGHNPKALEDAGIVIDLGSQAWTDEALGTLTASIENGAKLKVLPSLAGRRFRWGAPDTGDDVLLACMGLDEATVSNVKATSGLHPFGSGSVELIEYHPPYRTVSGNNRRDDAGTGWNIQHNSPELLTLLDGWVEEAGDYWPFRFRSNAPNTWSCGFVGRDGRRFVLFYNNEGRREVEATVTDLAIKWFPDENYSLIIHTLASSNMRENIRRSDAFFKVEIPPYGLVLAEMAPQSQRH